MIIPAYWRNGIGLFTRLKRKKKTEETAQVQSLEYSVHEEHGVRVTGAERRRRWMCLLGQRLGPALSKATHASSGSVDFFPERIVEPSNVKCSNLILKYVKRKQGEVQWLFK